MSSSYPIAKDWTFYRPQETLSQEDIAQWYQINNIHLHITPLSSSSSALGSTRTATTTNTHHDTVADPSTAHRVVVDDPPTEPLPQPLLQLANVPGPDAFHLYFLQEGIRTPTLIQSIAWPVLMKRRDFVGIAPTGSGKTLAFLIPAMLHVMHPTYRALMRVRLGDGPSVVVLAPTRELALQIMSEANKLSQRLVTSHSSSGGGGAGLADRGLFSVVGVYGGEAKEIQERDLKAGAQFVIATPGRLIDFVTLQAVTSQAGGGSHKGSSNRASTGSSSKFQLNLARVSFVVLDEADRMLDMGFEPQLHAICQQIKKHRERRAEILKARPPTAEHPTTTNKKKHTTGHHELTDASQRPLQTIMFSATWPQEVQHLTNVYMRSPYRAHVGSGSLLPSATVTQHFLVLEKPKSAVAAEEDASSAPQKRGSVALQPHAGGGATERKRGREEFPSATGKGAALNNNNNKKTDAETPQTSWVDKEKLNKLLWLLRLRIFGKRKQDPNNAATSSCRVLIFAKTKKTVDQLQATLSTTPFQLFSTTDSASTESTARNNNNNKQHHPPSEQQKPLVVLSLHGDKDQAQRNETLDHFRVANPAILVCTDVASRGLDIPDLEYVINYDFPTSIEDYVHRIGRTGRAGKSGDAFSMLSSADPACVLVELVALLRQGNVEVPMEVEALVAAKTAKAEKKSGAKGQTAPDADGNPQTILAVRNTAETAVTHSASSRHQQQRFPSTAASFPPPQRNAAPTQQPRSWGSGPSSGRSTQYNAQQRSSPSQPSQQEKKPRGASFSLF